MKHFEEPILEIMKIDLVDVIAQSGDDDERWPGGFTPLSE